MSLSRDIVRSEAAEPMSKPNIAAVRDRPATERRLIHAVEKLLVRGGFGVLGPSAVAREAGVDKMLIYRYFGNLDGLVSAVAKSPELFISMEEICAGGIAAAGACGRRRAQLRACAYRAPCSARDDGLGDGRAKQVDRNHRDRARRGEHSNCRSVVSRNRCPA